MSLKKMFFASLIPLAIAGCIAGCVAGCGGDDDGGGAAASYEDVVAALENPSGSIESAEGAQGVAAAFEEQLGTQGFGGQRRDGISCDVDQMTGETTCECTGGGSLDIESGGTSGGSASAHWEANNCCQSGGCCFDGSLDLLVATEQGATYSLCYFADYDINGCGKDASVQIQYCQDGMGRAWYVVSYQSETYAVTGSYNTTSGGTWTVRDANGEWTCTSDGTIGSCTNGTDTYDW